MYLFFRAVFADVVDPEQDDPRRFTVGRRVPRLAAASRVTLEQPGDIRPAAAHPDLITNRGTGQDSPQASPLNRDGITTFSKQDGPSSAEAVCIGH